MRPSRDNRVPSKVLQVQRSGPASTSVPTVDFPVDTQNTSASPADEAWARAYRRQVREHLPPPPTTPRHAGWKEHRARVWAALIATDASDSRLTRFAECGDHAFVQRRLDDPTRYRCVLETCHDRWCAPCAAQRRALIADHIRAHVAHGLHRFVTLSLRSSDQTLKAQLDRLIACFRRLRQRTLWRERVDGGLAGIELTWNEERRQWHPHLHAIIHGRWIGQADLSAAWRDVTGDSFIVDIRFIRDPAKVARYVSKYATKPLPASIQRDPDRLAEAVEAFNNRRTFVQFGDWAKHSFTRRPTDPTWETLGFLNELAVSGELPLALLRAARLACESITDSTTTVELTFQPSIAQDDTS
jgi:hypothetical protein